MRETAAGPGPWEAGGIKRQNQTVCCYAGEGEALTITQHLLQEGRRPLSRHRQAAALNLLDPPLSMQSTETALAMT